MTYSGPWCTIAFTDGRAESVKGSRAEITALLRGGGLVEVENVFGHKVTVGSQYVIRIDEGDPDVEFD